MHSSAPDLGKRLTTGLGAAFARLAAVSAGVILVAAGPAAAESMPKGSTCLQLPGDFPSTTPVVWEGAFSTGDAHRRREKAVCIHLLAKHLITIQIDAAELSTVGHVGFSDGHQEGAPGGRFFNEALPAGHYTILVGQRWPVWKPGNFKLIVSVK